MHQRALELEGEIHTAREMLPLFGYSRSTLITDTRLFTDGFIKNIGTTKDDDTGYTATAWLIQIPPKYKSGR